MNNTKKSIHSSGPLGMLVKSGLITKIEPEKEEIEISTELAQNNGRKVNSSYFKTQAGIEFFEDELLYVDPKECTPWKYANRLDDEMGGIDELIRSIKENKQLQPAVVRPHPLPQNKYKYEVIFGRRRHLACLQLGIPFLVIKKEISSTQDAVVLQDAENKYRQNVSNYSNAMLYKKLLSDEVFKTDKELAEKLGISPSTFSELMAYSKIPLDILNNIPNIHGLSNSLALKIVSLCKSDEYAKCIFELAPEIGLSISSPAKLENAIKKKLSTIKTELGNKNIVKADNGKRLFTFKTNSKGIQCIEFAKEINNIVNYDELCNLIKDFLEKNKD